LFTITGDGLGVLTGSTAAVTGRMMQPGYEMTQREKLTIIIIVVVV